MLQQMMAAQAAQTAAQQDKQAYSHSLHTWAEATDALLQQVEDRLEACELATVPDDRTAQAVQNIHNQLEEQQQAQRRFGQAGQKGLENLEKATSAATATTTQTNFLQKARGGSMAGLHTRGGGKGGLRAHLEGVLTSAPGLLHTSVRRRRKQSTKLC